MSSPPYPATTRANATLSMNHFLGSDSEFDAIYDEKTRELSPQHWTPVRVAARAARLLTQAGASRILDVGSGAGKFCIVGALSTDAHFLGVERREHLVHIASTAATRLGATRATFVQADVATFSFEGFDGVYLYNPFHEQVSPFLMHIDTTLERSEDVYWHFVQRTTEKLAAMAAPVAVVTFNGFGGPMPPGYTFLGDEPAGCDRLELWLKLMR